ncbi:MAG: CidA/LrgA family protein [Nocardioides sp.]|nr:CidA/LrgA family protein [Nocardioides sp.]
MLPGLVVLLLCQFAGELAVRLTGVPLPGPVAGMLLLVVVLAVRRPAPDAPVLQAADGLLAHLQLLFVPAGVGVVTTLAVFRDQAPAVLGGIVLAWLVGLLLTGWSAAALLNLQRRFGHGRRAAS